MKQIPQTSDAQLEAAGLGNLPLAPDDRRVDLEEPTFSNPTEITNPLFPISDLTSAVLSGHVEGKPFHTETTLLPTTRVIEWPAGHRVDTRVSQYVAYLGGQIEEVALDHYAQEEVTVRRTGVTVRGPHGPVHGAMIGEELHSEGSREDKAFAPGYGEFFTGGGGDVEADALDGPVPAALETLSTASAQRRLRSTSRNRRSTSSCVIGLRSRSTVGASCSGSGRCSWMRLGETQAQYAVTSSSSSGYGIASPRASATSIARASTPS